MTNSSTLTHLSTPFKSTADCKQCNVTSLVEIQAYCTNNRTLVLIFTLNSLNYFTPFQIFSLQFSPSVHSFNHSTLVQINCVRIDAKHCLVLRPSAFIRTSVKRIVLHCYSFVSEINTLSIKGINKAPSFF